MEILNFSKENPDTANLRLVAENKEVLQFQKIENQFINYIFFRINPDWRKLNAETKRIYKSEFQAVYHEFETELLMFSYSLVGFDSKAEIMLWRIGNSLDAIQDMTAKLYRTNLGSFLETADNYLAATKKRNFVAPNDNVNPNDRKFITAGEKKYHFVYPFAKHGDWHQKPPEERDALVEENFMVGRKFSNIKIHLTHAFGFSEQEYIISFETDEPKDFLALAEELKEMDSKFLMRGMPVYTCRKRSLMECLDAVG